jgi:hypothetical protein
MNIPDWPHVRGKRSDRPGEQFATNSDLVTNAIDAKSNVAPGRPSFRRFFEVVSPGGEIR